MSAQQPLPAIRQGWVRAFFLLIIYIGGSVAAGLIFPSGNAWFVFSFVFSIALVFFFRRLADKKSFVSIGLGPDRMVASAFTGLFLGILLVCIASLLIFFLRAVEWTDTGELTAGMIYDVVILLMVAASEELVFRGYILRNLTKSFNRWLALVISAALFAVVHASNPGISMVALFNTFMGGLLLGVLFFQSGSLWSPVFFHFSWNFIQGPVIGFPVSGHRFDSLFLLQQKNNILLNGGIYGLEGSPVASLVLLAAFVYWAFLLRRPYPRVRY